MTKIHPKCPKCKDQGWVEEPYYSDFRPRMEYVPCSECNSQAHHKAPSKGVILLLAAWLAFILAMVAKGFPVAS